MRNVDHARVGAHAHPDSVSDTIFERLALDEDELQQRIARHAKNWTDMEIDPSDVAAGVELELRKNGRLSKRLTDNAAKNRN